MAPYRKGRWPPSRTGRAARHPYRPRPVQDHGVSSSSIGTTQERPVRGPKNTSRRIGNRSRSVASIDSFAGAGSIASDPGNDPHEDPLFPEEAGEVIMALEMKTNGVVGCAYYVAATFTLYLQEDTRITGLELVESLLFQAQPSSIIAPSRAREDLIEFLDRQSRALGSGGAGDDGDGHGHGFEFRTVVSSDFSAGAGKQALSRLGHSSGWQPRSAHFTTVVEDADNYVIHGNFPEEEPAITNERNQLMQLGTSINLDNCVTLGCVGALVLELERKKSATTDAQDVEIRAVQTVTYKDCMFVTADTLLALQIFHPDLRQGFGRGAAQTPQDKKSIFDLFNCLAHTSQGRAKLREMFVRPSTDLGVINARHDAVACLMDPANVAPVAAIRAALKKCRNVRLLLLQLKRGLLLPGKFATIQQSAWSNLHVFCHSVLGIQSAGVEALQGDCHAIIKALDTIDSEAVVRVADTLARYIDVEESRASGRSILASGVSSDLDSLKANYGNLQARLGDLCDGYRAQLAADAQDDIVGCIFHPQMGYLLVASAALQAWLNSQSGVCGFETWEEALHEDGLVYYKTEEVAGVDAEFGDLAGQIIELEAEILHSLGSAVLEEEEALLCASDAIGAIDSIFALAAGAQTYRLSRPRMTSRNVLHIKQGRHLLQEVGAGKFVPNNCYLTGGAGSGQQGEDHTDDRPSAIVVTGPNHSGKSVYLKQAATILFLAQVGSYVPAEAATIGITDKILTRIATCESVSRDESAFGVDLRQAAFAINFATRRSLVLVDEFGKGTAPADGAALFAALIGHFVGLGRGEGPKVLAATHFHEIFDGGRFEQHAGLGLCHMSVSIDSDASRPEDKVNFLHVLREGRSTESFGCSCAAMNGVVSSVVERANQITGLLAKGASLEKICLRSQAGDAGALQEKEARVRRFLAAMAEALESSLACRSPRSLLQLVF